MSTPDPRPQARNVLVAANLQDGAQAIQNNPRMANWDLVTIPSQIRGLWVEEWAITAMASDRLRDAGIYDEVVHALAASTIHGTVIR